MFRYGEDKLTAGLALALMRNEIPGQLSKLTKKRIQNSHELVKRISTGKKAFYGINTGFGPLCTTVISAEQTSELQRNLLLSHSVGVGSPISPELSKLMLILKLHALSMGYSGVSPEVTDRIYRMIEEDIIPVVPEKGSVGASGDLAPLSHLFLPLIGEGQVWWEGNVIESSELLNKKNLDPILLGPKDGLALINGTQFIAAHAVILVEEMFHCLEAADVIGALSLDSMKGSLSPFDERLHQVRPFEGSQYVAYRMRKLIEDSEILKSHANCERVQDPYSLRCMPQVHGASRHAWLHLKEQLEVEINSVTDNPVVFGEGDVVSGGNFHGQPLAMVLDYCCLALSELGNISDRRIYLALEGKVDGVPKLLTRFPGVHSGFMILQYTSAALSSENKSRCFPSSADSIPTSLGQEDHVSMGSISARKALEVAGNVQKILAIELLTAAQGLDFLRPLRTGELLEKLHQALREKISFADSDRVFAKDINACDKLLTRKFISELAQIDYSDFDPVILAKYSNY